MDAAALPVQQAVLALKGLADPTRVRLLALLGHGELTVGEICRVLGQSQPRVSRHLKLLQAAGMLDRFREQQCVYYRVPAGPGRPEWLRQLVAALDPEDVALRRDRVRLGVVLGDRQRSAEGELGAGPAATADPGLGAVLRELLGPASLGELLDVGTGAGRMLELLGGQATRAIGLDLSTAALRLARSRVHGLGLAHCEFQCGDMYALPFDAASFDTLALDRVLAGAERPAQVLAEAARVLRPAGRLLAIESCAALEACAGGPGHVPDAPVPGDSCAALRTWLWRAGLAADAIHSIELASGAHVLALARPAAAGPRAAH